MSGKIPGVNMTTLSALSEPNRMNIVELLRERSPDRGGNRRPAGIEAAPNFEAS